MAQERSAADLSLDFVTPELVLAARVYGLGPAEAAQAARLALAGPGQLTAMASAVDRTFVQALAIESIRREGRAPVASGEGSSAGTLDASEAPESIESMRTPGTFGVERRAPRGAFLWPSATVGALGLTAAASDGVHSMSVAALELLAAQTVAELGTYAAFGDMTPDGVPLRGRDGLAASTSSSTAASTGGETVELSDNAGEAEVMSVVCDARPGGTSRPLRCPLRRARQSPNARTMSPAARAARALALAGRGEDAPSSAYERAAAAWDVLPVVYATDGSTLTDTLEQPTPELASVRGARSARGPGDLVQVDGRPGLGALSVRAGEALGSYVAPMAFAPTTSASSFYSSSSSSSSSQSSSGASRHEREVGALLRPPTAAQELVRTGRPAGRHGGGEVEIPPWFEAAARRMLDERSDSSDGISLAELTLVTAAPAAHVAASTRTASTGGTSLAPASATSDAKGEQSIDVEKLANEVYRQILVLMDVSRARNGEPYL